MSWEEMRKKQKKKEYIFMLIIVIILSIGFIFEAIELSSRGDILQLDSRSLSLMIIQIQATIETLTITVLALLGGRITDAYLGVSLIDYVLNRKPKLFKQKKLIFASILILVLNIVLHMFGLFYIVFSIFLCTCIIVWASIDEIYELFSGSEKIENEIKSYIEYQIKNGEIEKTIKLFKDYCFEWKRRITYQGIEEYNDYDILFDSFLLKFIKSSDTSEIFIANISEVINLLLLDEKNIIKAMILIKKYYIFVCKSIYKDGICLHNTSSLFYMVSNNFRKSILKMPIKLIEENINWYWFIKYIVMVDSLNEKDKEGTSYSYEIQTIKQIGGIFGYYIVDKNERTDDIWGEPLTRGKENWSKDNNHKIAERLLYENIFGFVAMQIKYDKKDLVKEYIFSGLRSVTNIADDAYIRLIICIHCYLYYLAFCESESCVDKEIINRCKNLIINDDIKSYYCTFILTFARRDKNIIKWGNNKINVFNGMLPDNIFSFLKEYEEFPKRRYGIGKKLILEDVVEQYLVFLCLYLSNHNISVELIDKVFSIDRASQLYLNYIKKDKREEMKVFFEIMGESKENVDSKTESAYSVLIDRIRVLYKKSALQRANVTEAIMDQNIDEEKRREEEKIKKYFQKEFSGLITKSKCEETKIHLFRITTFSDEKLSETLDGIYDWMFKNFTNYLTSYLEEKMKLKYKQKKDFENDDKYLQYIKSKKDKVFVGSEYVLHTKDFDKIEELKELLQYTEHYLSGIIGKVMILEKNSIHLNIKKVEIDVHNQEIDETNAIFDDQRGMYVYEVSSGMSTDFTEEELNNYLNCTRRVIDVYICLGIDIRDGIIGEEIIDEKL